MKPQASDRSTDGVVFTGEGKLARKATGYEKEKAEAALSHIGVRGLRKPSFRRPLERIGDPQISPTRQFLKSRLEQVSKLLHVSRTEPNALSL